MYAIHFLPTKYLIDKNGKIIAKYNGGEEAKLDADLKNAFGF
jgi:glutathione peroxidase-family protein